MIEPRKPRIVLYDLETSHMIAATFGLYNVNIPVDHVLREWEIFSAQWKYLGEDQVFSISQADHTEREVVQAITSVIHNADLIIAHNGDKFDIRKLNGKVFTMGLPPFNIPSSIDTLKECRRNFSLTSNRLDYVAKALGFKGKTPTSRNLWIEALKGNKEAIKEMEEYGRNDVVILEQVYLKLLPFIKNHPSIARLMNVAAAGGCPNCGSLECHNWGTRIVRRQVRQRRHCKNCGTYFNGEIIREVSR